MKLRNSFVNCSGYMAPEYAMHGYLSVKTDVFSYGVLVLEIVSGRKNHDGKLEREKADLLSYVSYFPGEVLMQLVQEIKQKLYKMRGKI